MVGEDDDVRPPRKAAAEKVEDEAQEVREGELEVNGEKTAADAWKEDGRIAAKVDVVAATAAAAAPAAAAAVNVGSVNIKSASTPAKK